LAVYFYRLGKLRFIQFPPNIKNVTAIALASEIDQMNYASIINFRLRLNAAIRGANDSDVRSAR
jgi:hypothetical protein